MTFAPSFAKRPARATPRNAHWKIAALVALTAALGCGGEAQTPVEDASAPPDVRALDADRPSQEAQAEGGDAASSCEDLASEAQSAFGAILESHRTCDADGDCIATFTSGTCFAACGLAIRGADEAEVISLSAGLCRQFDAQGCKLPPVPCPRLLPAKCVGGRCANAP